MAKTTNVYLAINVANYFLQKAFNEKIEISAMKYQKLVYNAHGWHLGLTGHIN